VIITSPWSKVDGFGACRRRDFRQNIVSDGFLQFWHGKMVNLVREEEVLLPILPPPLTRP
jgi:hypothetical protein